MLSGTPAADGRDAPVTLASRPTASLIISVNLGLFPEVESPRV